jgi:thioredoxin-like negative regulator of GroEL
VGRAMLAHAITALSLFLSLQGAASPKGPATTAPPNSASTLNILFFTASWCEPCRAVQPILEKFAHKNKKDVKLVIMDFDRAKAEVASWDVQEVPVVIVVSAERKVLLRFEGARQDSLATLNSALEDLLKGVRKGGEKCRTE